jgi:hypothetical protein
MIAPSLISEVTMSLFSHQFNIISIWMSKSVLTLVSGLLDDGLSRLHLRHGVVLRALVTFIPFQSSGLPLPRSGSGI